MLIMLFFQSKPFHQPVDPSIVPTYNNFVVCPMDLSALEKV